MALMKNILEYPILPKNDIHFMKFTGVRPGLKVAQLVPIHLVHFVVGTGTLGQRSVRNQIKKN